MTHSATTALQHKITKEEEEKIPGSMEEPSSSFIANDYQ